MAIKPKITIVTPAYNAEEFIAEAIESVQAQSFKDYEHIIVDDGSSDETAKIVKQYAAQDPRISYVYQKNQGPSVARNQGIVRASGDYTTFLDADDLYAQDTLLLAAEKSVALPDIIFYDFVYYLGESNPGPAPYKIDLDSSRVYTKEDISGKIFNVFPILTCNKFISTKLLRDKKLLFNKKYLRYEDVDFSIRATLAANTYSYFDYTGYYYRIGREESETATNYKHATQLLRILVELNKLITSSHPELKQSFDNYAIDQIVANINMQEKRPKEQKEVFVFAQSEVIPSLGLASIDTDYVYNENLFDSFVAIKEGDFTRLLKCRIELLKKHISSQDNNIKTMQTDIQRTRNDFTEYRLASERNVARLEHEIETIHQSISWRSTKPLRLLSGGARRFKSKQNG